MRLTTTVIAMALTASLAWAQRPVDEFSSEATKEIVENRDNTQRLDSQMASWLALGNYGEIQLAKLAIQKSQNDNVRQFAQQMAKDHSSMLNDLKKFVPQVNVEQSTETDTAAEKREIAEQHHNPLMEIGRTAAKNKLGMTTKLLEQYEGQDFDMGYLGQQMVAHVELLATLHAMKDKGSDGFQQVVAGQIETVENHFKHARELSERLEDDRLQKPLDRDRIDRLRPQVQPQPRFPAEPKDNFKPRIEEQRKLENDVQP